MRERIDDITADFYINQKPTDIEFTCPYCYDDVSIKWSYVDVPEYWGDDWGWVECPLCGRNVKLGSYDIG